MLLLLLAAIFLHQPSPSDVVIPIGAQVALNCSLAQGYTIERWNIQHPLRNLDSNAPKSIAVLLELGINVVEISSTESILIVNASEKTSGIKIICEAYELTNIFEIYTSCIIDTLFYGKMTF